MELYNDWNKAMLLLANLRLQVVSAEGDSPAYYTLLRASNYAFKQAAAAYEAVRQGEAQ